jgi:hypothetical protein
MNAVCVGIWAMLFAADPAANTAVELRLPPRAATALSGAAFFETIKSLEPREREAAIRAEITAGNVPAFLRRLKPIALSWVDTSGTQHAAKCDVTADYLAVGSDDDFFRVPMRPGTGQQIAQAADASLITAKLSDAIFAQAELKLEPRPMTSEREKTASFYRHHQWIEEQRRGSPLGLLVAGIKKDVVLTNRLAERPGRVAIYGWHYPSGRPIQPLYVGHSDAHVDYSHGIRLVSQQVRVDGRAMRFDELLCDPALSGLVSTEGPITARYAAE